MSVPLLVQQPLKDLVHELVAGNHLILEVDGRAGRLTAQDISRAIGQYGRTLVELPDEAFENVDIYPIKGQEGCWAIDLPLWAAEEGRSDFTLSVTACITTDGILLQIDDLHVL